MNIFLNSITLYIITVIILAENVLVLNKTEYKNMHLIFGVDVNDVKRSEF